ncbi:MAG: hypothetical protein JWM46_9 [Candidatus Kaiserbacteria bacterium]|nr:hypothetical protein [Candidatus Kaiserbacteria bacterium]
MEDEFSSIAKDLEIRSVRLRMENDPRHIGNDEIVFAIAKLVHITGISNRQNERLERSNFRLQMVMMALTAITTLIALYPAFKIIFTWLAPLITNALQIATISSDYLNLLSGLVSVMAIYGSYKYFEYKVKLEETITLTDAMSAVLKDKDGNVKTSR